MTDTTDARCPFLAIDLDPGTDRRCALGRDHDIDARVHITLNDLRLRALWDRPLPTYTGRWARSTPRLITNHDLRVGQRVDVKYVYGENSWTSLRGVVEFVSLDRDQVRLTPLAIAGTLWAVNQPDFDVEITLVDEAPEPEIEPEVEPVTPSVSVTPDGNQVRLPDGQSRHIHEVANDLTNGLGGPFYEEMARQFVTGCDLGTDYGCCEQHDYHAVDVCEHA